MGQVLESGAQFLLVAILALMLLGCAIEIFPGDDAIAARAPVNGGPASPAAEVPAPALPAQDYPRLATNRPNPANDMSADPATATRTADAVESLLRTLSLRQRIGQRFIVPVPGRMVMSLRVWPGPHRDSV